MASGFPSVHQRKLGPAPIASFEDLSDEVENGETVSRMPGIIEVTTPVTPANSLKTPSTPRIDISRASSSSQHEEEDSNSRESTPEKELLAGSEPPSGTKLVLGYKEDADDIVSSTEELDLRDPVHEQDLRRELKRSRKKRNKQMFDGTQSEHGVSIKINEDRERKDSNCSEIILLNISGRTSRISSVGSQGSGVSANLSAVSPNSSRLHTNNIRRAKSLQEPRTKMRSQINKRIVASPSPHKCLLETSFCGSVSTSGSILNESSKVENDDLIKILLQREEDSTRALIPENVRIPIVAGNIKPDPLDMPRRRDPREERKEIFRREVEITKRVLKKVNVEVPIIKLTKEPSTDILSNQDCQKPDSLNLNDNNKRKNRSNISTSATNTPKLQRHRKINDIDGSRTPSPSTVSRKNSFTSIFRSRGESNNQSHESPSSLPRRSISCRLKETADILRSRSKSRERPSSADKSPGLRKDSSTRSRGSLFSSTLSLFRKRERKKSGESIGTPDDTLDGSVGNIEKIGKTEPSYPQNINSLLNNCDSVFISLHGDGDENSRPLAQNDTKVSSPPESPIKNEDGYASTTSPDQQPSGMIVSTEASIEHHRRSKIRNSDGIRYSSSSGDSSRIPDCRSNRDSYLSRSDSRDSNIHGNMGNGMGNG